MKERITKLSRLIGVAAVGVGLLGSAGCEEAAKQCGFECDKGIAQGNASITGLASVDNFFGAVVRFKDVSAKVSGSIDAELKGIQADFGITDAEVSAAGDLGAALKAKLDASIEGGVAAGLKVKATPAKCDVDAQASFKASADCQVEAGCDVKVDPGKAEFECKGGCTVEASASVSCGANVEASCTFKGPEVACTGECKGTCTVNAMVAGGCEGSCGGTCMGECQGTCSAMDGNGMCAGTCDGTCKGTCTAECKIESSAGAKCEGKCSGECVAKGPMLDCTGAAEAHCEGSADASVMCNGKCDGEFEPPMAMAKCDASAQCNAQAEANASLDVTCTPPSVEIDYELTAAVKADASASAKLEFALKQLATAHLPGILASLKKGELVVNAAGDLVTSAEGAADGIVSAVGKGDINAAVAFKLSECAPDQFKAVGTVMGDAKTKLEGSVKAAASVTGAVGL